MINKVCILTNISSGQKNATSIFHLASLTLFVFLKELVSSQWFGDKEFSDLNGPMKNNEPSGNVPIDDYRFSPRPINSRENAG